MAPIYTTNSIQTNLIATLLRRFILVGQTDKTSDTNLILQTITIRFRRRSTDAFQTNLIALRGRDVTRSDKQTGNNM